jgi:hypothetical protein
LATGSLLLASASSSLLLASASSSLLLASASSSLLAVTSGLLVDELLAVGSLLLASASSSLLPASASILLVDELLATGHLAGTSVLLVDELCAASSLLLASAGGLFLDEAMVFVRPHVVDGPLPILVRALRASVIPMKNGPPAWPRRQQSVSLLVFADGSLMPIFDTKRPTEGVQGGGGCSVRSSRTTTRGRVGEAATI